MSPRPPDILRKSHRHAERKERATAKEQLREEASAAVADLDIAGGYVGRCGCGALSYRFSTRVPPSRWAVRACECKFCRRHGAIYTSDPAGSVVLGVEDTRAIGHSRCGHGMADFLTCQHCGDVLAAVASTARGARVSVNLRLLENPPPDLPAAEPVDYGAETREQRQARWETQWTPMAPGEAD